MMKNLKLAWRNIWRNKRRTLITVLSIFFGVILSTFMGSMQEGVYGSMIDNVVKNFNGHIQVQNPEYFDNNTINNTFDISQTMIDSITEINHVKAVVPRLKSYTLISSGNKTRGGLLIGINAEQEDKMSNLSHWVVKGEYLKKDDDGVLMTINLAEHLKVKLNDSVVLISQGYHGASSAGVYKVKGIVKFPTADLNSLGLYMTLKNAQDFYYAPNKLTEIAILSNDYEKVSYIKRKLKSYFGSKYSYLDWKELSPELVQFINSDKSSGVLMKAILYLVIAFGIFGTIIMMIAERMREFGVIVAVGMQKKRLQIIVWLETMLIGISGLVIGFAVSIPIIFYLSHNPIPLTGETAKAYEQFGIEPLLYFRLASKIFVNQILVIFAITLLVSLYPVAKIRHLNVIKSIRG